MLEDKSVWWTSCWILSAKPLALLWSLNPFYNIKKTWCIPNLIYISCPYTSITISMLELMYFPSNEKKLHKRSTSYTRFMSSTSWLPETSCHTRPSRQLGMPLCTQHVFLCMYCFQSLPPTPIILRHFHNL